MVQIIKENRKPSFAESVRGSLENYVDPALEKYAAFQKEQERTKTASRLAGEDLSGFTPEMQQAYLIEKLKGKNKLAEYQAEQAQKLRADQTKQQQEEAALRQLEKDRGFEPGALNAYKGNLSLAERSTRPKEKTQASQPIDPEQRKIIEDVRSEPGFKELDELGQYQKLTNAGVSKENSAEEAKLRGAQLTRQGQETKQAYDAQKTFIDDTTNSYRAFEEQTKPKLLQMQRMDPDKLASPIDAVFLEELGIPLGALDDPSSELYQKLSLDLLKGLPETYGNRILKVEVDNFLRTIPQLINSPDGRRMIASNMLKLGEMKGVYYNEMRRQQKDYLDTNKPLPRDFEQRIFDQVKPQIDRINDQFVKMADIKSVPPGKIPFFDPSGTVRFVDENQADWAMENGGTRIW